MLKHKRLRNVTVATPYGQVTFNEKGESKNLSQNNQKALADRVEGFEYVEEKKEEPKKKTTAKKDEDKEEEKKPTRKRSTTKKKIDEDKEVKEDEDK